MSKYTNIYINKRRYYKIAIMWVMRALIYVSVRVSLVSNGKDISMPVSNVLLILSLKYPRRSKRGNQNENRKCPILIRA